MLDRFHLSSPMEFVDFIMEKADNYWTRNYFVVKLEQEARSRLDRPYGGTVPKRARSPYRKY